MGTSCEAELGQKVSLGDPLEPSYSQLMGTRRSEREVKGRGPRSALWEEAGRLVASG